MSGGLAASPGSGCFVAGACAHGGSGGCAGGLPAPLAPLRIPPWVLYEKEGVFDVCDTLARAESALIRAGEHEEAARVADAFTLLEAGLAGPLGPAGQPAPVSSSMASELTQ